MNNKTINNHISQNTSRAVEREFQTRDDYNVIDKMLSKKCDSNNHDNVNNHENIHQEICNTCELRCKNEHGGEVFVANIGKMAWQNNNFRESIWTGKYLQTTLMSIERGKDIGVELHSDTDQYIRVEYGMAMAFTGNCENHLDDKHRLCAGDAIYIPAGTWHNIVNIGRCALKLSSVYAPPHHPKCTVEKNKA